MFVFILPKTTEGSRGKTTLQSKFYFEKTKYIQYIKFYGV